MNLNSIQYTQTRRRFGRQIAFSDRNEMLFDEPARHEEFPKLYILRNPDNKGSQLSRQFAVSEAETENPTMSHHGVLHIEGGWPKDVNYLDEEAVTRHRKKTEREDNYSKELLNCIKYVSAAVKQNNAVNIYQDYFTELNPLPLKQTFHTTNTSLFHDILKPTRPIINLNWASVDSAKFLSVHTTYDLFPMKSSIPDFYVWDVNNQLKPFTTFQSRFIVTTAYYCPKDENLIAGGLKNGMVCIWDSRTGGMPYNTSPLETAHRDQVTALCWVHSKSNTEFYTGSSDSSIRYWDGRNLRSPTTTYYMDPVRTNIQEPNRSHGISCLQFEYTIPVRYLVGTEHGQLFLANRKGMTAVETLVTNYRIFNGPVLSIERHPFLVKNFLCIGEWCVKIWTEECKDYAITRFPNHKHKLNCGAWSPTRSSSFVTGSKDGKLDFWDMLLDQKDPVYTVDIFNGAITAVAPKSSGEVLAVGTENGDVFLIQLEDGLVKGTAKDKAIVAAAFERELHRCKLLEGRAREIRLNAAKMNKQLILEPNFQVDNDYDDMFIDMGDWEDFGSASELQLDDDGGIVGGGGIGEYNAEEMEEVEMEEEDPDPELTETKIFFDTIYQDTLEKNKEKIFVIEKCAFDSKKWAPDNYYQEIGEEFDEEEET